MTEDTYDNVAQYIDRVLHKDKGMVSTNIRDAASVVSQGIRNMAKTVSVSSPPPPRQVPKVTINSPTIQLPNGYLSQSPAEIMRYRPQGPNVMMRYVPQAPQEDMPTILSRLEVLKKQQVRS